MRVLVGMVRVLALTLIVCGALGCCDIALAEAPASSPAGTIEEFPVETIHQGGVGEIAAGPEENMWLVQESEYYIEPGSIINRIAPGGQVTGQYGEEGPLLRDIVEGPEGNMWFTNDATSNVEQGGVIVEELNEIGRIAPNGVVTEFKVPNGGLKSFPEYTAGPLAIAEDREGNMWFTDQRPNKEGKIFIGRRSAKNGEITEFHLPSGTQTNLPEASMPLDIALGPEGNMWFTDQGHNNEGQNLIGQITSAGKVTEFPIPTPNSGPTAIALGADGNMWFTEAGANKIGRITPAGVITEFSVPGISGAINGIAPAPDGNMWFTGIAGLDAIGWISPTGAFGVLPGVPPSAFPHSIAMGADGDLWFTDPRVGEVEQGSTSFVGRLITPLTPANSVAPEVSGQPLEGQVLSASAGSWAHEPTAYAHQWQRCSTAGSGCEDIAGATGTTYLLGPADVGHTLRAIVTASTLVGSSAASSNLSATIAGLPPASSPPVATTGVVATTPMPPVRTPTLAATLTWSFAWSARDTIVRSLVVHGLSAGSLVEVACAGRGCAFKRARLAATADPSACRGHRCKVRGPVAVHGQLDLTQLFKAARLRPGARVTVGIDRPGWIGKSFVFTVQRNRIPSLRSSCLVPGSLTVTSAC